MNKNLINCGITEKDKLRNEYDGNSLKKYLLEDKEYEVLRDINGKVLRVYLQMSPNLIWLDFLDHPSYIIVEDCNTKVALDFEIRDEIVSVLMEVA